MRTHTKLRHLLALALLAGCGERRPSEPAPQEPPAGASAPVTVAERAWLFAPDPPPPPAVVQAFQPRFDPAAGGWTGELWVAAAEPVLRRLADGVFLGEVGDADRSVADLAEVVRATPLLPERMETLYDDGTTRVREGRGAAARELSRAELVAELARLRGLLADCHERRYELELVGVRMQAPERVALELTLEAAGRVGEGGRQLDLLWRAELERTGAQAEPRIAALELVQHREAETQAIQLVDLTQALLGHLQAWDADFRRGADDVYKNTDRALGAAFLGSYGLAVGDANGDGLEDVYVCQPAGTPNRLLLHQSEGILTDFSYPARAAWLDRSRAALFVDLDNDGDQDLAVALNADILIGWNDGKGIFEDWQPLRGTGVEEIFSLSAADPDEDGDLDLYACRYTGAGLMGGVPTPYYDANNGATNFYWRNDGPRRFTQATEEVGLGFNNNKYSLASIWDDFDHDGDLDLYVTNDFGRNTLYRNDQGSFREVAGAVGADDMAASMGATCADVDLDGNVDIYVSNMHSPEGLRVVEQPQFAALQPPEIVPSFRHHARGNTLLLGRADGGFTDVSESAGVSAAGWSWGGMFVDLGNDGLDDLYVPNGFVSSFEGKPDVSSFYWREVLSLSPADSLATPEYAQAWKTIEHMSMHQGYPWAGGERNRAFLNLGGARFADVSSLSGADALEDARAVAVTDWDGDGRLDLVVKARTAPRLRIWHNRSRTPHHWVAFALVGTRCNRDAIGALVTLEVEGRRLSRRLYAGSGYLSQSSKTLHFGLGAARVIEAVEVRWPGGGTSRYEQLAVDTRWQITQDAAAPERREAPPSPLAALPAQTLVREGLPVQRIPLVEKLPLAPLELPSYGGPARTLGEAADKERLLYFWSQGNAESVSTLRALARSRESLEKAGLRLLPCCVDEESAQPGARALLDQLGLAEDAGPATSRLLQALDVILVELKGNRLGVALPLGMLCDSAAQLLVLYPGQLDLELLARDLRAAQSVPTEKSANQLLMGGQWFEMPRRDYSSLAKQLANLGLSELAAFYGGLAVRKAR